MAPSHHRLPPSSTSPPPLPSDSREKSLALCRVLLEALPLLQEKPVKRLCRRPLVGQRCRARGGDGLETPDSVLSLAEQKKRPWGMQLKAVKHPAQPNPIKGRFERCEILTASILSQGSAQRRPPICCTTISITRRQTSLVDHQMDGKLGANLTDPSSPSHRPARRRRFGGDSSGRPRQNSQKKAKAADTLLLVLLDIWRR
jgi:hypothetical protein